MIEYFFFLAGIVLLIEGAKLLVSSSSSLAKKIGVSSFIIGLTIVATGTSMPELIINLFSAIKGQTEIALGNVIGSNIANILLVLGVVAILSPLKIHKSTIWKEIPLGILAAFVLLVVANDKSIDNVISSISRTDGIVMLFFFLIFIYYVYEAAKKREIRIEEETIEIEKRKLSSIIFLFVIGILLLYLGGKFIVENAVIIASNLGISKFLISAFVIALGTSLPELATSIAAVSKKDLDLAVGNVVGSNIFNIFWVLGLTASISPIKVPSFINFDIFFLIISSLLLFIFALKDPKIKKERGLILIILYITYIAIILRRG